VEPGASHGDELRSSLVTPKRVLSEYSEDMTFDLIFFCLLLFSYMFVKFWLRV